ncbi:MAG TPA: sugar phosphate isomerase/epimerase family protein [Gemmatales bacterium]|nr:sugar phosphate isomerase/epimerase family protein [Gemmatales bacterium]
MKKISIGSWAYVFNQENVADFHTVLHKLQDLKLDGVELGSFGIHPTPKSHPTRAARQALKREVADHGLTFSGIAPDLWSFKIASAEDPAPYLAAFLGYCRFTEDLGIKMIRIDTIEPPDVLTSVGPELAFERVVQAFDIACKMAADHGLAITWEFEPGFVFNKPSEIVALVDAVRGRGHANFGVLFDACHAHMCAVEGARQVGTRETLTGGVIELLHKLRGRINHVHLIDCDGTLNEHQTSTHNPFGTGKIDFDKLLPELAKAEVPNDDWWTIDLCFWPDAWNVTASAMKFLDARRKQLAG